MAEMRIGDTFVDTDIRVWEPRTRRLASLVGLALATVLVVAAAIYFGLDPSGAEWFLWVGIVGLALLFLFESAVVATGIARERGRPGWLAGPGVPPHAASPEPRAPPETVEEPEAGVPIDLRCPECEEMFVVEDTGERPLETECPHCGVQGRVDAAHLPPPEVKDEAADEHSAAVQAPAATEASAPSRDEEIETVSLKCPACQTEFDVEDTGERPLKAICPGCGSGGKLR